MVGAPIDVFTTNRSGFDVADVDPSFLITAVSRCDPSGSLVESGHAHWSYVTLRIVQIAFPFSITDSDTMSSSSSSSSSETTEEVPVRIGDETRVGDGVWSMVGAARPWVRTAKSMPAELKPGVAICAVQVYPPSPSCCVHDQV